MVKYSTNFTRYVADTRWRKDGQEFVAPANRFYGSTVYAAKGRGLSERGYLPSQVHESIAYLLVCFVSLSCILSLRNMGLRLQESDAFC